MNNTRLININNQLFIEIAPKSLLNQHPIEFFVVIKILTFPGRSV